MNPPSYRELLADCGSDSADHPVEMINGVARFKPDPVIEIIMDDPRMRVDLNRLWLKCARVDTKECSLSLRRFYRDMGYSLCGFLEIFGEGDKFVRTGEKP